MSPKNIGRPKSENSKKGRLEIRTSEKEEQMLQYCCDITGKTKAEIVRIGIKKVYEELKK